MRLAWMSSILVGMHFSLSSCMVPAASPMIGTLFLSIFLIMSITGSPSSTACPKQLSVGHDGLLQEMQDGLEWIPGMCMSMSIASKCWGL